MYITNRNIEESLFLKSILSIFYKFQLIPGDKYSKIDVNCKLPVYDGSNKPSIKQTPTALAFHIQQYMNSGSSELR